MYTPATEETLAFVADTLVTWDNHFARMVDAQMAINADTIALVSQLINLSEVLYVVTWTIAICTGVQFGMVLFDRFTRKRSSLPPM